MANEVLQFKIQGTSSYINIVFDLVNNCPHCFKGIKPHIVFKTDYDDKLKSPIAVLSQCPSCEGYFVNSYKILQFSNSLHSVQTELIPYTYKQLVQYDLPKELEIISPTFKEIYEQSLTAESDGLEQICGIGFRKSIEFLLKDFLINHQNENRDQIVKITLSQAINKLESEKIRNLAKASVWLGNDETHYQRKYEDKDIHDMKRFIRALAYFISSELTASDAQDFINQ